MNTTTMPHGFSTAPLTGAPPRVCLLGISEWEHMRLYEPHVRRTAIETYTDCIDRHRELGFDGLVWNCARSIVYYQSRHDCNLPSARVNDSDAYLWRMIDEQCPLRSALTLCRERGMALLGRVAMNRHYGPTSHPSQHSRFVAEHPQWQEREIDGQPCPSRMCFAIDQVQQERIDVLLEIQRIGADALVLDFCRQPPMLMYHPALVEPFTQQFGRDPRQIDSKNPDDYRDWFQCRADVLTGFLRRLRERVAQQADELGPPCPIVARFGDAAPWINLAYGLDVDAWLREDLVDALMLSPYPLSVEDDGRHPAHYVALAHRHGKACFGGIGSFGLMVGHDRACNEPLAAAFDPRPVFTRARAQLGAGVDAMTVYQSETLMLLPHLREVLPHLADRNRLKRLPHGADSDRVGVDWHSAWLVNGRREGQLLGLGTPPAPGLWRTL